jgi:hypothetical protein
LIAAGIAAGCAVLLKISAALAALWFIPTLLAGLGKPPKPREIPAALVGFTAPFLTLGGGITHLGANLGRYDALPSFSGGGFAHAAWERAQFWFGAYAGYGGLGLGILLAGCGDSRSASAIQAHPGFRRGMAPDPVGEPRGVS